MAASASSLPRAGCGSKPRFAAPQDRVREILAVWVVLTMCELFGMSARRPTDVNWSLALLRPRGGEIGPHSDGWGVAFYEGRAARVFKEPVPAAESGCLAFISDYGFQSRTVVGHIRRANPATFGRSSANTHPFDRELGGRSWVFADNGKLDGLRDDPILLPRRFLPIGETESQAGVLSASRRDRPRRRRRDSFPL